MAFAGGDAGEHAEGLFASVVMLWLACMIRDFCDGGGVAFAK